MISMFFAGAAVVLVTMVITTCIILMAMGAGSRSWEKQRSDRSDEP